MRSRVSRTERRRARKQADVSLASRLLMRGVTLKPQCRVFQLKLTEEGENDLQAAPLEESEWTGWRANA
jgi:hypothetical protein